MNSHIKRRHNKKAVEATAVVGMVFTALIVANLVSVWWLNYPFLYCWTADAAAAFYMGWGTIVVYIAVAFTAYQLFKGNMVKMIGGTLVCVAIFETLKWLAYFFAMGGSCG